MPDIVIASLASVTYVVTELRWCEFICLSACYAMYFTKQCCYCFILFPKQIFLVSPSCWSLLACVMLQSPISIKSRKYVRVNDATHHATAFKHASILTLVRNNKLLVAMKIVIVLSRVVLVGVSKGTLADREKQK